MTIPEIRQALRHAEAERSLWRDAAMIVAGIAALAVIGFAPWPEWVIGL